ncbi:MAG: SDR family NAD(P)-dependent oxidoreductase [Bradyrhizobium sp.]|nr:SDR family NAD(P)-dependent oxidoreductase [Bradyrhizobium sp.]
MGILGDLHHINDDIAIVGWACRFPGANSTGEFWDLMARGRCSVTRVPGDRFSLARFGHPRRQERGRSYSWAAGVLDNVWHFDPGVFGISPREAIQMDPQQRLLLQLTWEAFEDAGIRPSTIAGKDVGVYVGASQIDYAHTFVTDQAIADSHFATGTALAILANRISYIFDLRGPSVTVDTACSSSLVALHQAVEALRSGRIDTAIVGGTNVITSPSSFIAFSQASMLSPTGLCQAFSSKADGFVRAEGGGIVILRRLAQAQAARNPIHGFVLATDVNSDGRTGGISLPSLEAQHALLERIYGADGVDPDRLAFVEAHGTGTAAGDPIEATALGRGLGQRRSKPLPIGSVKTNIGHLEPGAGIAGLIKSVMALNHGVLPPSLHCDELNPNIAFDELNLKVCREAVSLRGDVGTLAGVNSFGFGGTNAHAVVAGGKSAAPPGAPIPNAAPFVISAETAPALVSLAQSYADKVDGLSKHDVSTIASAAAHRREHMSHRLVVTSSDSKEIVRALRAFAADGDDPNLAVGNAVGRNLPIAFVYAGNGSQWIGMGQAAHRNNAVFRKHFDRVGELFAPLGGWSLRDILFSEDLAEKLSLTSVAQPLIFAIQSAITAVLTSRGIRPVAVLGHSVGEIAAAEAAGILDLETAIRLVYIRSHHQERTRGFGRMVTLRSSAETVREMLQTMPEVEIAAFNSPRSLTLAGPADKLAALATANPGVAMVDLDLDYPFHTGLLAPIQQDLIADLKDIRGHAGHTSFVSTVTGQVEAGEGLDGAYWWRNVREPVRLVDGLRTAAALGARFFLDIGARPTLIKHITDTLDGEVTAVAAQATLDRRDEGSDPFDRVVAKALVTGAAIDIEQMVGADPGPAIKLPSYPWQQREFRFEHTVEAVGIEPIRHPFAGMRHSSDSLEWHANIDTAIHPALQDHKVGEQVLFPGTAFLEIAFAVAREWLKSEQVAITNFEIMKALDLTKGEVREIMTRVSPGSNVVEIFSRPRLSHAAWMHHCRGKMQHGNRAPAGALPPLGDRVRDLTRADVYRIASDAGLHYGPGFQLVRAMHVHAGDVIDVCLDSTSNESPFVLDPIRTDCCSHGIFAVLPDVQAKERGVAYIPVRIDRAAIYQPNGTPARAVVEIHSKTYRAISATYWIVDRNNDVLAVLDGVRCQAVPVRHMAHVEAIAVVEAPKLLDGRTIGVTGLPVTPRHMVEAVRAAGVERADDAPTSGYADLLDGFAMAEGHRMAQSLADDGIVDPNQLVTSGRIPADLAPWLVNLMVHLENAGLASERHGAWRIVADNLLPKADALLTLLATEHPERGSELLLAGALSGLSDQIAKKRAIASSPDSIVSASALDFYKSGNVFAEAGRRMAEAILQKLPGFWPKDRSLRILQLGYGPLTHSLALSSRAVDLTVLEPDRLAFDRAEAALSKDASVRIVPDAEGVAAGAFDAIVSVDGLHRQDIDIRTLRDALATNGLLIAIEAEPSLFRDMVFGLDPRWFDDERRDRPVGRLRSASGWRATLSGFAEVETISVGCGSDAASLIVASVGRSDTATSADSNAQSPLFMVSMRSSASTPLSVEILRQLKVDNDDIPVVTDLEHVRDRAGQTLILTPPPWSEKLDSETAILRRCLDLKSLATALAGSKTTLWLIFVGALGIDGGPVHPVESGTWSFSRTLANEFPTLDIRRINVAVGTSPASAARLIENVIRSGTSETELHTDGAKIEAIRIKGLKSVVEHIARPEPAAGRLQRRSGAGQWLLWESMSRVRPGPHDVEIAVEATGLNFRDLMWMLSLLPDDMLEDGFTGPTLGLECAGRIARVGSAVTGLKPGDPVVALAASAFATHTVVPAARVAKVPHGMPLDAAATIPVAFLTAYYALIKLAHLDRGETVLIHGGAGAVGMAAIQIAQWRGARIVATAGSPAKRSLLKALGVAHVLDSRSTAFVESVRKIEPGGVDVVLNSLAGDAMEMSIACLGPFGRFVELGKRDYVSNTHIGLRPFRKNLSYFGVDLDQLVVGRETIGEALLKEVMALFESGAFTPLPYSVFGGSNVAEAFHLMQQSSHIGKIIVKPAPAAMAQPAQAAWAPKDGTHVITGAFGGFGAEVARWLADQGARHLVLVGRKGADRPDAKALVHELTERGVTVVGDPCDIADLRAVEALFRKIHATMPPVVGVMHAAMVLDDAILANLSEDRFRRVLSPKVKGADNLDLVTRGLPLDYFVLFSSVTTLIGNPGQANYVAANGYMEGLARRRRQMGLPALAVGWGPITDVGVVATSDRLRSSLEKLTGVKGIRAREGLDMLAQALALPQKATEIAAMAISPNDGNFSKERLPILRSPTYGSFVRSQDAADAAGDAVDLRALLQQEPMDAVRRKVSDVVVRNLGKVLHARPEDISRVRPLGEIGLDSLMTLELVMSLEAAFGLNISLVNSVGTLTVSALSDEIIAQVNLDQHRDEAAVADIAGRHVADVTPEAVQALKGIVVASTLRPEGRAS